MKTLKDFISDYDDYKKGKPLYQYRMVFSSINKHQRDYLFAHFQDYSGDFAIVELSVSRMPKVGLTNDSNNVADILFEFSSTFDFLDILPSLIGKEQFLSNIFYDGDKALREKAIRLYTDDGSQYAVEVSKYGGITNMPTQQDDTLETRLKTRRVTYQSRK
jgi:hypothetical protein